MPSTKTKERHGIPPAGILDSEACTTDMISQNWDSRFSNDEGSVNIDCEMRILYKFSFEGGRFDRSVVLAAVATGLTLNTVRAVPCLVFGAAVQNGPDLYFLYAGNPRPWPELADLLTPRFRGKKTCKD